MNTMGKFFEEQALERLEKRAKIFRSNFTETLENSKRFTKKWMLNQEKRNLIMLGKLSDILT